MSRKIKTSHGANLTLVCAATLISYICKFLFTLFSEIKYILNMSNI